MSNPFVAKAENVGNVYRDITESLGNGDTYVMVSPTFSGFAIVSLFGSRRWEGLIEGGNVFEHKIRGEPELEYIGKIDSVNVKREIVQIKEVRK